MIIHKKLILRVIVLLCTACLIQTTCYGTSALIVKHKVVGTNKEILENIQAKLVIFDNRYHYNSAYQYYTRNYQNKLKAAVQKAIQPYGFYNSSIQLKQESKKDVLHNTISVTLNEPVKITKINLNIPNNDDENSQQRIREQIPLKAGEIFKSANFTKAKQMITTWASNRGYIQGEFAHSEASINTKENTAVIYLDFNAKEKFFFGDTTIKNSVINHSLIKKYITYLPESNFSTNEMQLSYNNIAASGLFEYIEFVPKFDAVVENKIPVELKLTARKAIGLQFGIGYTSTENLNANALIDHRRINKFGHTAKVNVVYSQPIVNINFNYNIPGNSPLTSSYNIVGLFKKIANNKGNSSSITAGINWHLKYISWKGKYSVYYLQESFKLVKDQDAKKSKMILPSLELERATINNQLFPTKGYRALFDAKGTSSIFLATDSFIQATLKLSNVFKYYKFRVINKHAIGMNFLIDDANKLPLSLQLLTGGNDSIRGYEYNSIGTGKYLYLTSIDVQYPIYKNYHLTIFYDIGNVTDKLSETPKNSIGTSIMLKSPIGPISIGIAKGLVQVAKDYRIFFNIGVDI